MIEEKDVQDLLNTGIWTTQRAKSPRPSNPVRANQPDKIAPLSPNDPKIPRTFSSLSHTRFPPPPSVEDEEDSIAKESNGSIVSLNEEEPKCKGDRDQFPIILPVPEHNPERRFVLVAPSETKHENSSGDSKSPSPETKHTANSKAGLEPRPNTSDGGPSPLDRSRSRNGLPRIETDFQHQKQPGPSAQVHRSRSATFIDQSHRDASSNDYFSLHPESARPVGQPFLTPVVKHATKGRDRAYWDFNPGANGTDPKGVSLGEKPRSADRSGVDGYARPSRMPDCAAKRRLYSDIEVPKLKKTVERQSSYRDELHSSARNGPLSPSSERKRSPPRPSRKETSPTKPRGDSLRVPRNRPKHHGRSSSTREAVLEYSSDDGRERKSNGRRRERRGSAVIHEDRSAFLDVSGLRSTQASKPRSKPPSPLQSPTLSQGKSFDRKTQAGPRVSTVFSGDRPVSPTSSGSSTSPRSRSHARERHRAPSRTPSMRSNANHSKPVTTPSSQSSPSPLPLAIPSNDRTRQTMPPTPAWSRQSSLNTDPCWHAEALQPPTQAASMTPRHSDTNIKQSGPSVITYRRYSEDVSAGTLPDLPDCPRKRPRAGLTDWFTLPRNDIFNVCPSCYEHVFYPTSFRDLLVPAPTRSRDRALACDMGTSPWYRIAWLMTCKYRRNDLRLLQGIADVSLRNQVPCYGSNRVTRTWYSILDPESRRCISSFKVCAPCAESVQVLFPSLKALFIPADRQAEPRSGQCSLHFAPQRTRFLTYFDILEDTHDRAVARSNPPNIERLVERIDSWAGIDECPHEEPLRQASWYTMASIPQMTVCEDCFLCIVYPELVGDVEALANGTVDEAQAANAVARNFDPRPQLIRSATVCQMASPWMKDLFRRACRRPDGVAYLDSKVKDRLRSV